MNLFASLVCILLLGLCAQNEGQTAEISGEDKRLLLQQALQVISAQTTTTTSTTTTPATPTEPPPVTASLSLKDLILVLMAKHGNVQTALAFNSLDSLALGEIMRVLLVEVDKSLSNDIISMQNHAQNNDKQLVAVIARIVTGDASVSKDIFAWDDKLRKYPWWQRIRQRMFINLDKYVSQFKSKQ